MKRGSDDRGESQAEKSVRRKTEKLRQCTRELQKELDQLDHSNKKSKKEAQKESDARKAEFLRQAAVHQRRVDEYASQLAELSAAIARDEPELLDMRARLADLMQQHRERCEILEADKAERLRPIYEEIERLEASAS